jgi:hypothetical protein
MWKISLLRNPSGISIRGSVLAYLIVLLISLTIAPNVQAQTTTITNLQYPNQAVLQNGVAQVTVTFTVSYAGLPSGDWLIFGILYSGTSTYVTGSGTSSPDHCFPSAGTPNAKLAVCVTAPISGSGTESGTFSLTFNSTQLYSLEAGAGMTSASGVLVSGSVGVQSFTISVTSQTVSTTSTAEFHLTPLSVLSAVVITTIALRRRKSSPT